MAEQPVALSPGELYTIEHIARWAKVSPRTIRREINDRRALGCVKLSNNVVRISGEQALDWKRRHTVHPVI